MVGTHQKYHIGKSKKHVTVSVKEKSTEIKLKKFLFTKINIGKSDISPKISIQTLNFKKYWEITNIKLDKTLQSEFASRAQG